MQILICSSNEMLLSFSSLADDANNNNNNNDIGTKNNNNGTLGELHTSPSLDTCHWQQPNFQADISNEQESGFHDAHLSADISNDSTLDGDLMQQFCLKRDKEPTPEVHSKKSRSMVSVS